MVEHHFHKMIVIGSNPIAVTKKRDVAQLVEFMVWDHDVAGPSPVIPTKVKNYTIFNNKNLQVSKINSNFVT